MCVVRAYARILLLIYIINAGGFAPCFDGVVPPAFGGALLFFFIFISYDK